MQQSTHTAITNYILHGHDIHDQILVIDAQGALASSE